MRTKGPAPVMEIVRWLRKKGLAQGFDFDFKYQQVRHSMWDGAELHSNGVSFFFREEKWATFMRLKYGDDVQGLESSNGGVAW